MKWLVLGLVGLALLGLSTFWLVQPPAPHPAPGQDGSTFYDVTVIQPGEWRLTNQTLRVARGQIASIAPSSAQPGPYAGMFLLPGFVNMHVHHPPQSIPVSQELFPLLFLMHGVTTVRDAGDLDGETVQPLRNAIRRGDVAGPRIFACGPFVDGLKPTWESSIVVANSSAAAGVVERIASAGYDCLKVYDSIQPNVLQALVAAAKKKKLSVIGHVPFRVAYPGGISDVQHFSGVQFLPGIGPADFESQIEQWGRLTSTKISHLAQTIVESGTANTPTLITRAKGSLLGNYKALRKSKHANLLPRFFRDVIWNPVDGLPKNTSPTHLRNLRLAVAKEQQLVKALFDKGAILHIGTDTMTSFVVPGADMIEEMTLFAEAGLSPESVLKLATSDAGKTLLPNLGRLERGAPADFLLFSRDPTQDLRNLSSLEAVIADGRLYTKQELSRRFTRLRDHWSHWFVDPLLTEAVRFAIGNNADE